MDDAAGAIAVLRHGPLAALGEGPSSDRKTRAKPGFHTDDVSRFQRLDEAARPARPPRP